MRKLYNQLTEIAARPIIQDLVLLFTRIGFGAIFWQSSRTKVAEGTFLTISDTTHFLFAEEYAGVPIPADIAAPMALYAETFLPILLLLGLGTRFAAAALIGMTLVIQLFVYPDAWWVPHMGWVALGLVLLTQGSGRLSLDYLFAGKAKA